MQKRKRLSVAILAFSALVQIASMTMIRAMVQGRTGFLFPFGIAVYMLQGLGYLIGIYRRRHMASVKFVNVALYVFMFPIVYAGPLITYLEYEEQLSKRPCNIIQLSSGLELFVRGLAEKVILADTFGYIFRELRQTGQMSMLTAWLTTLSFSMYIYFELLGYSEMARGLGKCFGFQFPKNFSHPFFTSSITAFLQSWNITLLLWFQTNFRYFLFSRFEKKWQKYGFLILTWALIGAWYGIEIQFMLWGICMGILLSIEQIAGLDRLFMEENARKKRYVFGLIYTAILQQFSFVLLFADNLTEAGAIWKSMLSFGNGIADQTGFYFFTSYIALLLLGLYVATDLFQNITERISVTPIGQKLAECKPLVHGLLFLFCLASMLYGERMTELWLKI
jgi:alginate O-acetyltransferase complex protein AlgI